MRRWLSPFIFLLPLAASAAPDPIEATARLVSSGAIHLALARVERLQPAQPDRGRWPAWEGLRLTLLAQLERHEDILARVEKLPRDVPGNLSRQAYFLGARAALTTNRPVLARTYLARHLWQPGLPEDEYRQARLMVIDSYFAERNPTEAYFALLRFQQEFQSLPRERAQRYVEALTASGMEREATAWLAYLDDGSPLKLLVRLKNGLVAPDAAIAQARAALKKTSSAGFWAVLMQAGTTQRDLSIRLEAQEQLLNLQEAGDGVSPFATRSRDLWQAYQAGARELANRQQLLAGDDAAWFDFATRLQVSNAPAARAVFAYLAADARFVDLRHSAQLQLVGSLQQQKLASAAVRLFNDSSSTLPDQALAPLVRYQLGAMAVEAGQYQAAAKFWKGLSAPQGITSDEWQLKLAQVFYRANLAAEAEAALRLLLTGRDKIPVDAIRRCMGLAQEMLSAKRLDEAERLATQLVSIAEPQEQRDALVLLARAAETRSDYKLAADYFLQAATLFEAGSPDGVAQSARFQAAANLVKAGLREDARAQYQWLLKATKDKAQLEAINRELKKL